MDLMVNFERNLAREKLLEAQLSAAVILIEKQEDTVVNLQFEVNQLKKILFKGKGERFVPFSLQLSLAFDDQEVITVPEPTKEKISFHLVKKKHPGRNALPEHIPVEEIIMEPEGITSDMIYIGNKITETLDYIEPPVLLKKTLYTQEVCAQKPRRGI